MVQQLLTGALAAVMVLGGSALSDRPAGLNPNDFKAELTGAAERPNPVETTATGTATVTFNEADSTFTYELTVSNLNDVTAAHIHIGKAEEAGPPAANLLDVAPAGAVNGTLCSGTIKASDLKGETIESLLTKMRAGDTYVNVHTKANPDGEIRGQLVVK
jgi:CHRD domain